MTTSFASGWSLRLVVVLGRPIEQLEEAGLRRLIDNQVREEADPDLK
jgi:predicted HTH transcriptional regulator